MSTKIITIPACSSDLTIDLDQLIKSLPSKDNRYEAAIRQAIEYGKQLTTKQTVQVTLWMLHHENHRYLHESSKFILSNKTFSPPDEYHIADMRLLRDTELIRLKMTPTQLKSCIAVMDPKARHPIDDLVLLNEDDEYVESMKFEVTVDGPKVMKYEPDYTVVPLSDKKIKEPTIAYYVDKITELMDAKHKNKVKRLSMYPPEDDELFTWYKKHECAHWTVEDYKFADDREHYLKASDPIKTMIKRNQAFFMTADGAIINNLAFRFLLEAETLEEMSVLVSQIHREVIHAESYGLSNYSIIANNVEFNALLKEAEESKYTKAKIEFIEEYMRSDQPQAVRYFAFCLVEGVFLANGFVPILWFREQGLFPAFVALNKAISNDEAMHAELNALQCIRAGGVTQELAKKMVDRVVSIEDMYADFILETEFDTLNRAGLKQYCRSMADKMLVASGCKRIYNVANPYPWVDEIGMEKKTNPYERTANDYRMNNLKTALDYETRSGRKREEFKHYDDPSNVDF